MNNYYDIYGEERKFDDQHNGNWNPKVRINIDYPNLTLKQEEELFLDGSDESIEVIICAYLKLAYKVAKNFHYTGIEINELMSECVQFLVECVNRYTWNGVSFQTYFKPAAKFHMTVYCNKQMHIAKLSDFDASYGPMVRAIVLEGIHDHQKELTEDEIIRLPKIQELLNRKNSRGTNIFTKNKILAILGSGYLSLDRPIDEADDDNDSFGDLIPDSKDYIKETESRIQVEQILDYLSEPFRETLKLICLSNLEIKEVSKRLKISKTSVYNRINDSKKFLLELSNEKEELKEYLEIMNNEN